MTDTYTSPSPNPDEPKRWTPKRSPPRNKTGRKKVRGLVERNKVMTAEPAQRARWAALLASRSEDIKRDRKKYTRLGIPHGMRRFDADEAWFQASAQARHFIRMLENNGDLRPDKLIIPDSDEGLAKAALFEAAKIALGPLDGKLKLAAINTVLNFTKQKPVTKIDTNLSANDWLKEAVAANKASNAKRDTE